MKDSIMQTKFLMLIIFYCAVYMSPAKAAAEGKFEDIVSNIRDISEIAKRSIERREPVLLEADIPETSTTSTFLEEVRRENSQTLRMLHKEIYLLLEGGNGVEKNIPRAIEYCERLANLLGDSKAQEQLPKMLYRYSIYLLKGEEGVEKNIPEAISYCERAAELGNSKAKEYLPQMLYSYSMCLFKGKEGVEKDMLAAIGYCERAEKLGNDKAREDLPKMLYDYSIYLFNGAEGIERDLSEGISYCARAANLGNQTAVSGLFRMTTIARSSNQKIIKRLSALKPPRRAD
jgi:TPR repeat protein